MTRTQCGGRSWWSYLAGVAAIGLAGLLWQGLSAPRAAYAQIPDSGEQRNEMINELRTANKKLTEMASLLREIRDAQSRPKKGPDAKAPRENP